MQTYINPFKEKNNDHTRITRKVRFRSFFKIEIEMNLIKIDFLDVTFNFIRETLRLYKKLNNKK